MGASQFLGPRFRAIVKEFCVLLITRQPNFKNTLTRFRPRTEDLVCTLASTSMHRDCLRQHHKSARPFVGRKILKLYTGAMRNFVRGIGPSTSMLLEQLSVQVC